VTLDSLSSVGPRRLEPEREVRRRDADATKRSLLAAAEIEFAAHGYQGARLRTIAVRCGVQPALIHHYYGDKRGLYRAMLQAALAESSTRSWHILEGAQDFPTVVSRFVRMLLRFNRKYDKLITILRREAMAGSPAMEMTQEAMRQQIEPVILAVKHYIRARQDQGEVRADVTPEDILLVALPLCSYPFVERGFLETVLPEALLDDDAAFEHRQAAIVDALLRYCAPRES
jgi:TetR/AcrR family transcriptional regulator